MTKKTQAAKQNENKIIEPAAEDFPVVGIGASAGGLQAFEEFFSAMPSDSGLAFVLISYLDPSQISILPELIQKKTGMKVCQAADQMPIAPNRVYIIPPNRNQGKSAALRSGQASRHQHAEKILVSERLFGKRDYGMLTGMGTTVLEEVAWIQSRTR